MAASFPDKVANSNEEMAQRDDSNNGQDLSHDKQISAVREDHDFAEGSAIINLSSDGLVRNRSTLHVAFMSFVLASIPYGLATSLFYPLVNGGPATIIWGWLSVSVIILCVAASLAEITSVHPTAGGVYYQTFMLLRGKWQRPISWICGFTYLAGNILITLAVNFGSTGFLIASVNVFESEPGVGIFQASVYQQFLVFVAITILCNLTSALGNRWLPVLDVGYPIGLTMVPKLTSLSTDLQHLLDFRRSHCHHGLHLSPSTRRSPFN